MNGTHVPSTWVRLGETCKAALGCKTDSNYSTPPWRGKARDTLGGHTVERCSDQRRAFSPPPKSSEKPSPCPCCHLLPPAASQWAACTQGQALSLAQGGRTHKEASKQTLPGGEESENKERSCHGSMTSSSGTFSGGRCGARRTHVGAPGHTVFLTLC